MGAVIVSAHKKSNMPKWLLNCLYKLLLGVLLSPAESRCRLGKVVKVQLPGGIVVTFALRSLILMACAGAKRA